MVVRTHLRPDSLKRGPGLNRTSKSGDHQNRQIGRGEMPFAAPPTHLESRPREA